MRNKMIINLRMIITWISHDACLLDIKEEQPYELPANRVGPEKGQPRLGVGACKFNADGTLLASRNGKSVRHDASVTSR